VAFCQATDRLLRQWRPDVVHLHNYYHHASPAVLAVLRAARRRGDVAAVVMTAHDYHLLCPSPGLLSWEGGEPRPVDPRRPLGVLDKVRGRWDPEGRARSELRVAQHVLAYDLLRLRRTFDVVICPSRFLATALEPIVPTRVLANPAPAYRSPPARGEDLQILFAGRLAPEKGLLPFLEAAPTELLDHLLIAGTGPEEASARRIVERRGATTTFLGQVPHEEMLGLIDRVHAVLLPARNHENAPTILFEALSRGASILGSALGGIREIVEDSGIGHLFDPWDPADVDRACRAVLAEHRAGTLAPTDAGAYLAERSEDRYATALIECYARLVP
jgi:glycosyltransferase involved in cell wall biosynthesis